MIWVLDFGSSGCEFTSQPVCYQVTTLGQLLTPMCLCHEAMQFCVSQRPVTFCSWQANCVKFLSFFLLPSLHVGKYPFKRWLGGYCGVLHWKRMDWYSDCKRIFE